MNTSSSTYPPWPIEARLPHRAKRGGGWIVSGQERVRGWSLAEVYEAGARGPVMIRREYTSRSPFSSLFIWRAIAFGEVEYNAYSRREVVRGAST
jgi:hypothetical protein